ncbi:MAG: DUF4419 domain-containing protein [Bacteroidales bacterium]
MKTVIIFFLIFCLSTSLLGQQIIKSDNRITFTVSNVIPARNLLRDTSYKEALEIRIGNLIEGYPLQMDDKKLVPSPVHGFIAALHIAFAQHRSLTISPDMIWLMICQGAALHINLNKDSLRNSFENSDNNREICIRRDDFIRGSNNNDWGWVFSSICDSIKKYRTDKLHNLFIPEFSTTGSKEKAAFEVAFMDAMENYFDYTFETFCGIPEISLEGSVDDWKWIASNAYNLDEIGMKKWSDNLQPILNEFVNASQGSIDTLFWQSIYRQSTMCGAEITGWIVKFFPYIIRDGNFKENNLIEGNKFIYYGLWLKDLPTGISQANFNWIYYGQLIPMTMYSGFLGIMQDNETKSLRPEISWAISENIGKLKKDILQNDSTQAILDLSNEVLFVSPLDTIIIPWEQGIRIEEEMVRLPFATDGSNFLHENFTRPVLFPHHYNCQDENSKNLCKYIKSRMIHDYAKIRAEIEFTVTWTGTIDKVSITESNKPAYNDEIISIVKEIKGCQPSRIGKNITNCRVYAQIKIN